MADFSIRADSVDVEQIMEQIRARIREKRGVDYTEQEIRELATAKLEKFLDPKGLRSDLLERFRQAPPADDPASRPNYAFEENTLFESHRGALRVIRRLLRPLLKLFFNPSPLIQALNIQAQLNAINARTESVRRGSDEIHYELMHNLVIETTRMAIEVKNLKMKVESLTGRLEFNERRARALESIVAYRSPEPGLVEPVPVSETRAAAVQGEAPTMAGGREAEGPGQRSRRRRRRRGRRSNVPAASLMSVDAGTPSAEALTSTGESSAGAASDASAGSDAGHRGDDEGHADADEP